MNVSELLEREYGAKTVYNLNPETATVLTAGATKILAYNPRRVAFIIVNLGTTVMHVSPEADVSSSKGIYLVGNGGTLTEVWNEDFEMPTFEWYGLSVTSDNAVFTLEVLLQ